MPVMLKTFVLGLVLLTINTAYAIGNYYTNFSYVMVQLPQPNRLKCDYRLTKAMLVEHITAKLGNITLPILNNTPYLKTSALSAILFLIDTSDSRRQSIIEKNVQQIKHLLDKTQPHHQLGLAAFGTTLQILAPLGTAPAEIASATENLQAFGQTTELYRHALTAIRLLAEYPAQRKALFLFSDGKTEDQAYHHSDVVQAAKESQVVIYGLGYTLATSQSVHLQTLRRLSEETGGLFIQAGQDFSLPAAFLQSPFKVFDSGAQVTFDLSPAIEAGFHDMQTVHLTLQTQEESLPAEITVTLPPIFVARSISEPPQFFEKSRLIYLIPMILLLLLVLVFWLKYGKQFKKKTVYAYLEFIDDDSHRYQMTLTTVRIGRHIENDLRLHNTSVSSHHAELHRRRDGSFALVDLDSLNGVYVNNKAEKIVILTDGDLIELGEVRLKFIMVPEN